MEKNKLQAHSNEWYDKMAETQSSYYYPWKSVLPQNHGEDAYFKILQSELTKDDVVLDIGCGSGELTNTIANYCKKIIGYDRVSHFKKALDGQNIKE
ncbi:MAG: hypothetical protein JEY96_20050 [Bacteroidales bacterium]|nr:hypothetical protein [Bacteroidales bacterium]